MCGIRRFSVSVKDVPKRDLPNVLLCLFDTFKVESVKVTKIGGS